MEWVPHLEFIETINQIFNNRLPVILFNYLLAAGVMLEIGLLLRIYYQFNKIEIRLERDNISADVFLKAMVVDYRKVLDIRKDREAGSFLESYFQKKKGGLLTGIKYIERSPGYYILAGFLGFFLIMLLAIFNLDLEGLSGVDDLTVRLNSLDTALKTGGYTLLTGLFSAFILFLVTRIWGAGKKVGRLKENLATYLDNVVRADHQEEDPQLEALNRLNMTIENSIYKLEEMFEDAFAASVGELEGQLMEINESLEHYRKLTEEFVRFRGSAPGGEGVYKYQKEAASSSEVDKGVTKNGQVADNKGVRKDEHVTDDKRVIEDRKDVEDNDNDQEEGENMAGKYKLVHACIRVMDLEKSIKFYQDAFGFEESIRKDFPDGGFTLVYLKGAESDFEVELTYNYDREEPYTIGNGFSHFAVTVSDLEASYQEHQQKGYEPGKIHSLTEGSRGFYFITDPDGYEVEVIQS